MSSAVKVLAIDCILAGSRQRARLGDARPWNESPVGLELQNKPQTFIDEGLYAWRQGHVTRCIGTTSAVRRCPGSDRPGSGRSALQTSPSGSRPSLPGVLFEGSQLGAMQRAIHLRGPARIHFIQALRDSALLLPVQELRNRGGVQLTSGNAEAASRVFRKRESSSGTGRAIFRPL